MLNFHYEQLTFRDPSSQMIIHRAIEADKSYPFPAHWHESLEMMCFCSGACNVRMDAQSFSVHAGDVVCINPNQIHYLLLEQPIRYHALIISPAFLKGIGLPDDVSLVPLIRDPRISELFETVITENRERLPFYRTAQNAAVSSLLVQLCRDYRNHDPSVGRDAAHNSKVRLVRQCMDYINRHYLDGISTSDISREIGITVNYLCACFKDVTNMTIKKYINSMKCRDAEAMLSSGSYTVTEAGLHCGFDNMAYFAKMYRLIIGENPSVTAEKSKTAAASPQKLSQRARDASDTHIPVAEAGTSGIPHATQS